MINVRPGVLERTEYNAWGTPKLSICAIARKDTMVSSKKFHGR